MLKYYCILAHTNPKQVYRLINTLNDEFSKFYIHIDKKSDIKLFTDVIQGKNIFFINKRYESAWGSLNIVIATLEIFKTVISKESDDGYLILLSGSDYPLKSNKFINDFLIENLEYNFINIDPVNKCWPTKEVNRRLKTYNFFSFNKKNEIHSILPINSKLFYKDFYKNLKKLYRLVRSKESIFFLQLLKKRRNIIMPFGGDQWFALKRSTVCFVLDWITENPKFLKSHEFTFIPDEIFFHSIIEHIKVKKHIKVKNNLTYVNWSRKNVKLPVVFSSQDIMELKMLDDTFLFARKFDTLKDKGILTKIDSDLRN